MGFVAKAAVVKHHKEKKEDKKEAEQKAEQEKKQSSEIQPYAEVPCFF